MPLKPPIWQRTSPPTRLTLRDVRHYRGGLFDLVNDRHGRFVTRTEYEHAYNARITQVGWLRQAGITVTADEFAAYAPLRVSVQTVAVAVSAFVFVCTRDGVRGVWFVEIDPASRWPLAMAHLVWTQPASARHLRALYFWLETVEPLAHRTGHVAYFYEIDLRSLRRLPPRADQPESQPPEPQFMARVAGQGVITLTRPQSLKTVVRSLLPGAAPLSLNLYFFDSARDWIGVNAITLF